MILTAEKFLACGLPVSSDLGEKEVEMTIRTFEMFYLKPILGDELYGDIVNDTDHTYDDAVLGTDTLAGLETAIEHGVFALMLYDSVRLTRYGSVRKESSESSNPSRDDILAVAKQHAEISLAFILDVCKFLDVKPNLEHNSFVFTELI